MITIKHFENGNKTLTNEDFIELVKTLFLENEEPDTHLVMPKNFNECETYVEKYCSNFEIISD